MSQQTTSRTTIGYSSRQSSPENNSFPRHSPPRNPRKSVFIQTNLGSSGKQTFYRFLGPPKNPGIPESREIPKNDPQNAPTNPRNSPLQVGCCGFPEAKAKYFTHFPAVELQTTFYEPPSVALAAKWRALAPPSFHFCVKAWQLITHRPSSPTYRRLKSRLSANETDLVGSFRPTEQVFLAWERTRSIAGALGARVILFQCPPSFEPDRENLANVRNFFGSIDRGPFLLAWEPRGDQWTNPLIRDLCAELSLVYCYDPFQRDPFEHPLIPGPVGYWRLHGKGGYSYKYSDDDLSSLHRMAERHAAESGAPLYIFFNNIWMKQDATRFLTPAAMP